MTKAARSVATLAALGFGSVEIGSVSIDPSDGNPKPRLWRLPEDRALLVHYGMQNDGARVVAGRVKDLQLPVPLGINIAVTNRGIGAPPLDRDSIIAEYVERRAPARAACRLSDAQPELPEHRRHTNFLPFMPKPCICCVSPICPS